MKLAGQEPRVIFQFDDLHKIAIRRQAAEDSLGAGRVRRAANSRRTALEERDRSVAAANHRRDD